MLVSRSVPGGKKYALRPWGLLVAVGIVASLGTVLGFLGRFHWAADLFAHFRMHTPSDCCWSVGCCFLWSGAGGLRFFFFAFAAVNAVFIVPLYIGSTVDVPEEAQTLRAMLLNVNTRTGDPARVLAAIQEADPDLLVLEEISARWKVELAPLAQSHPFRLEQIREDNFGIGVYSKVPLRDTRILNIGDSGLPSLAAVVATEQGGVRILATHPMPPVSPRAAQRRDRQLAAIPAFIDSSLPTLLLGDLNATPWSSHFRKLLRETGLRDSAKGFGVQPTWPKRTLLFGIPLDHILHSEHVRVVNREIGRDVASDHFPVIVDFIVR